MDWIDILCTEKKQSVLDSESHSLRVLEGPVP